MPGILLEYEPDDVEFIVACWFEEAPAGDDRNGPYDAQRAAWMVAHIYELVHTDFRDSLDPLEFATLILTEGEVEAWAQLAQRLVALGYSVYDSDTRFEVYPEGTVDRVGEVMVRMHVQRWGALPDSIGVVPASEAWDAAESNDYMAVLVEPFVRTATVAVENPDDELDEPGACPICGGPGIPFGTLGRVAHFSCRNCGLGYSREAVRA